VSTVAPQIFDVDVGSVWLGREAIVTNIDTSICDRQSIDIERVEAIGIFRQSLSQVSL
jgi:hypothetical protein